VTKKQKDQWCSLRGSAGGIEVQLLNRTREGEKEELQGEGKCVPEKVIGEKARWGGGTSFTVRRDGKNRQASFLSGGRGGYRNTWKKKSCFVVSGG